MPDIIHIHNISADTIDNSVTNTVSNDIGGTVGASVGNSADNSIDNVIDNTDVFAGNNNAVVSSQQRIRINDLCVATRQLASLLRAGMSVSSALSAMIEQLQGQELGEIIRAVHKQVNAGVSLADALSEFPAVFFSLFVNMVRAGQATGTLEDVLFKLADNMEKRARLMVKVKAAMMYPLIMAVVCVVVVVFLMTFVIPQISKIFLDMKHSLPLPTSMLIAISGFVRSYALLLAIVICAIIIAVKILLSNSRYHMAWDRCKLKLPLFGKLLTTIEVSRITRTLSIMLSSGVPVLQGLSIVKNIIQNSFIVDKIDAAQREIADGYSIACAIRKTGFFPPIMYHTIAIGEISGNLEEQLINVAEACDNEIETTVKSITVLIEPLILLIMGLVVGFIVLALLLPIFEINQMF